MCAARLAFQIKKLETPTKTTSMTISLPDFGPFIGRLATGCLLDAIEPGDAFDGLFGDGRALRLLHINELAADTCHALAPQMNDIPQPNYESSRDPQVRVPVLALLCFSVPSV